MERSLEQMKEIVFMFDGDLEAKIFGEEIEAQTIVDDYKWMITKIEELNQKIEQLESVGLKTKQMATKRIIELEEVNAEQEKELDSWRKEYMI